MPDKMNLTDAEWRARLSPEQYQVLRQGGTERAFTGKYEKNKLTGQYHCAGCGAPLFESGTKYDSGSGWPSFTAPMDPEVVDEHRDVSHGMGRTGAQGRTGRTGGTQPPAPVHRPRHGPAMPCRHDRRPKFISRWPRCVVRCSRS